MIQYNHSLSDEYINSILNTRGRFGGPENEYSETHHIIPVCLGGPTVEENLIDLYGREHYEVHRLLALENPNMGCLVNAWWIMATMKNEHQERYFITAEEYEEARAFYARYQSMAMSGEGNPMYGKNAYEGKSEEEMRIIAEKKSKALKGKKRTDEQKLHYRESKLGDKNPMKQLTGDKHPHYGKKYYQSPDGTDGGYFVEGEQPKGWIHKMNYNLTTPRTGENNPAYGRHWYHDGIVKIYTYECPEGFVAEFKKSLPSIKLKDLDEYLKSKVKEEAVDI